jgi:hypothetical protein
MGGSDQPRIAEEKLGFQEAYRSCDALAVPAFFHFRVQARSEDPARPDASAVAAWGVDQLLDHVERGPLAEAIGAVTTMKAVADRHGVKLVAFAGGQGLVGVEGGEGYEPLNVLFREANRHPRMGEFYPRLLDAWKQAGGGLFCLFASTGNWGRHGCWGLLQHAAEGEREQPKYRAVMEWNRKNSE